MKLLFTWGLVALPDQPMDLLGRMRKPAWLRGVLLPRVLLLVVIALIIMTWPESNDPQSPNKKTVKKLCSPSINS